MISKRILEITFLNEPELNFFTHLNGLTYFYQTRTILFTANHLPTHNLMFFAIYHKQFDKNISHLFTHS